MLRSTPQSKRGLFLVEIMNNCKQRAIVYVDGFNFYFGLKARKWKRYYWLDMVQFFSSLLRSHQELVEVKYFSAKPTHTEKADRQDLLFSANRLNPKFRLILGKYLKKELTCKSCGATMLTFEEKETDVRIATTIVADCMHNKCDVSIIVSADSDLVPPIELIREISPKHKVLVFFPPKRFSANLQQLADATRHLDNAKANFEQALLPETIVLPNGYELKRPSKWG